MESVLWRRKSSGKFLDEGDHAAPVFCKENCQSQSLAKVRASESQIAWVLLFDVLRLGKINSLTVQQGKQGGETLRCRSSIKVGKFSEDDGREMSESHHQICRRDGGIGRCEQIGKRGKV